VNKPVIRFGAGRFYSSLPLEQLEEELLKLTSPRKSFRSPFSQSETPFEGGYTNLGFSMTYLQHQGIQVRVPVVHVSMANVAGQSEVVLTLEPSSMLRYSRVIALFVGGIMLVAALASQRFEPLLFTVIASIDWWVKRRPLQDVADKILGLLQRRLRLTLIDFLAD
jgi:hypothetical protein